MDDDLKIVVRDNVRRLLALGPYESGVSKLMLLGFANGTAQRILGGQTSIGLDLLGEVARALKVQAWQLCVPGLDADRLPTLEPVEFRWPFRNIDAEVVTGLVGQAAQGVENGLIASLATLGISPRKRRNSA